MIAQEYIVKDWKDIPDTGFYLVFVRSNTFIAKVIHLGMWLLQFLRIKVYPEKVPQHSDIVYNGISIGALGNGVHPHSLQYRHRHTKKGTVIWVFEPIMTKEEKDKVWRFLLAQEGVPYEYVNFVYHAWRIFTGYWKGHTGRFSVRAWYCVELSAAAINQVWKGFIDKPWELTPYRFIKTVVEYKHKFKIPK